MAIEIDYLALTSLVIAILAASITFVRFKTESRLQRQADTVSAFYDIVRLIDNDRAVESRGLLRDSTELNQIRDIDPDTNDVQMPDIDNKTQEAARYVATTYDRLGFILKHDPKLEEEVLAWNAEVIADMWTMTRLLITKKWRKRNPNYAKEFERLAKRALEMLVHP
ncbi:MAG TPA: hypothetical protein VIB07_05340 [Nitrososphaera sp.]|jgi:hypothetical protein